MDYQRLTEDLILWVSEWFKQHADKANAIVPLSGNLIQTITIPLLIRAIGNKRIIPIITIDEADIGKENQCSRICNRYCLNKYRLPTYPAVNVIKNIVNLDCKTKITEEAVNNLPKRIRMASLYAMAESLNAVIVNTKCLSDLYIGNMTKFGDDCGDISPWGFLTLEEVLGISEYLFLKNDDLLKFDDIGEAEHKFGMTYDVLDKYIRTGFIDSPIIKNKIDQRHIKFKHCQCLMDTFSPGLAIHESL